MTTTTNLLITHIEQSQAQKEVTANEAFEAIDNAMSEIYSASLSSGNVIITSAQSTRAILIAATGCTVGGRTLTVPQIKRLFLVKSDGANTQTFSVVRGSTSISVVVGETALFYSDGTANGLLEIATTTATSVPDQFTDLSDVPGAYGTGDAGLFVRVNGTEDGLEFANASFLDLSDAPASFSGQGGKAVQVNPAGTALEFATKPYIVGMTYNGKPSASLVLIRHPVTEAVTFPASMTGSYGVAGTAATAQTDFDLQKNGVSFGTLRFAAAGTSATFIAASSTSFAAGDILTVVAPASQDATLAGLGFSLKGTR